MMNEMLLLLGFAGLILLALAIIFFSHRAIGAKFIGIPPLILVLVGLAYWHWGSWSAWTSFLQKKNQKARVEAMLATHSPADLIEALKLKLAQDPASARGWLILGRLYASQGLWQEAHQALAKAHKYSPSDENVTVNYVHSAWQIHHQKLDHSSRALLSTLLKANPNQLDALSMLAMDAYLHHDYQQAIAYWEQVLAQVSPQSDEARAIRKAIARAHLKIESH